MVYTQLKYMWARGNREETLHHLRQFTASLAKDIQHEGNEQSHRSNVSKARLGELTKLLARCYFKQGEWQQKLRDGWGKVIARSWFLESLLIIPIGKHSGYPSLFLLGNGLRSHMV